MATQPDDIAEDAPAPGDNDGTPFPGAEPPEED